MKFYFALFFTLINGYPVFQTDNDASVSTKTKIQYHSLGDNVMFAWKIRSPELAISIKFPVDYTWFVLGFKPQEGNKLSNIDEMAWIRVKLQRLSVQNADWVNDGGFTRSSYDLWEEVKTYVGDGYRVTLTRPLEGLKWNAPLKMIYAYGDEGTVNLINEAFSTNYKMIDIDLSSQHSFNVSQHKGSQQFVNKHVSTAEPKTELTEMKPTMVSSTTTSTIKTSVTVPAKGSLSKQVIEIQTSKSKVDEATVSRQTPSVAPTINKIEVPAHGPLIAHNNSTTPCPIKCNCTKIDNSHWYNILKEKENTVYFAIIGGCALFTGIIVLCIACCCARAGKPKIPRTRKHKVAFYKVDDFDSDDEEEMEFIEKAKEEK